MNAISFTEDQIKILSLITAYPNSWERFASKDDSLSRIGLAISITDDGVIKARSTTRDASIEVSRRDVLISGMIQCLKNL